MKRSFDRIVVCLVLILAFSCEEQDSSPIKRDADFFPLTVGNYLIYQVDETIYAPLMSPINQIYELKVSVVDMFQNLSGGTTYVINRFIRQQGQTNFVYRDTWSARVEADQVVVNEENVPYVKLAFPLSTGKQWNGNALNDVGGEQSCGEDLLFSCDVYEVGESGLQFDIDGSIVDDTIEIIQNNNTDPIVKQDVRREVYARNIGMIYKETSILEYCTVGSCIGQQQIEKGVELSQILIEYGKE